MAVDIVNTYIARLVLTGLKLLLGLLWLFVGRTVVDNWHITSNADHVYWFLSGLVLGLVFHAIFSFIRDILIIFDVISMEQDITEKVNHAIISSHGMAVAIKNSKGKYIYANNLFCETYGVTRHYIVGKTDESFMDELEVMKTTQEDEAVLKNGEVKEINFEQNYENNVRHIRITKSPLINKKNKITGIYIVREDITHLFELEESNSNLKKRYKRLFDDLPFPTMLLDVSTTLATEFNDALLNMLGYKRGEFYRTRLGLYMREDSEDVISFINRLVDENGGVRDIKLIGKNKDKFDIEAHFNVVEYKDKTYLHVIFRDVTENKLATDALVQSEQNYRTLFNHANDAIFIIDSETLAIVDANELAYLWLGYDDGELNSLSIFDVDRAGLEKVTREKINELAQHKDVLFEHEMCTFEGDNVPVEISAHTVIYGNKLAYQYVVRDISERKVAEWALRESEERYWQMFENNSSIMLVLDPVRWTIEDANEAAINFYKLDKDDLVGSSYDRISISSDKRTDENGTHIIKRDLYEGTHKLGDNDIRFVEINEAPIEIHGRQLCFNIIRDITDTKEVVSQLNLAQRMFASSSESVMVLDSHQHILSVNNALLNLSGYDEGDLLGQKPEIIFADDKAKIITKEVSDELEKFSIWKGKIRNRKKSGENYSVSLHIEIIKDSQQNIQKYVFMMTSDVEEWNVNSTSEITHNNIIGLPDKKHFLDRLVYALKKSKRSGKYIAIVLVDIRRFFEINERDGFDTGDRLLKSVGTRMQFMTRESDYVSHFGADKFAMLLEDLADLSKVNIVAQKVLSTLSEHYHIDEKVYDLTFAIGISLFPEDGNDANELLEMAESALSTAKLENKSRYQLYSQELNEKGKIWWDSERRLHEALKNEEFKCFFLPQFSLKDDSLSALEVLLRWEHPEKGLLEPAELLVEAENTGFIVAIGDWVIRKACYYLKELKSKGFVIPELVINISISQLDENFLDFISQACEDEGVDVTTIALDINESAMLKMSHQQIDVVQQLRDAGIKFQIDDFGKGNTSVSVLLDIAFDRVKMDARLINQLVDNVKVQKHCQMVHAMSEVLGFKIIAEGVEEQAQITELKSMQCDYAQGHYFTEAMGIDQLTEYLEKL